MNEDYRFGNEKGFNLIFPFPINKDAEFKEVNDYFEQVDIPFGYCVLHYLVTISNARMRMNSDEARHRLYTRIYEDINAQFECFTQEIPYDMNGPIFNDVSIEDQYTVGLFEDVLWSGYDNRLCLNHWVDRLYSLCDNYYYNLTLPEGFDIESEFEGDFDMFDSDTAIMKITMKENIDLMRDFSS